jgi:hypothetical protein
MLFLLNEAQHAKQFCYDLSDHAHPTTIFLLTAFFFASSLCLYCPIIPQRVLLLILYLQRRREHTVLKSGTGTGFEKCLDEQNEMHQEIDNEVAVRDPTNTLLQHFDNKQ